MMDKITYEFQYAAYHEIDAWYPRVKVLTNGQFSEMRQFQIGFETEALALAAAMKFRDEVEKEYRTVAAYTLSKHISPFAARADAEGYFSVSCPEERALALQLVQIDQARFVRSEIQYIFWTDQFGRHSAPTEVLFYQFKEPS